MPYQFIENCNAEILNEFCKNHPYNNIYQTSHWSFVKKEWNHEYVVVKENNQIVATAMILFRSLPFKLTMAYIPRGPIMDYSNQELVKFTLSSIRDFCKKRHAIECKFDPNIVIGSFEISQKQEAQNAKDDQLVADLNRAGAIFHGYNISLSEAVQPRFQCCFEIDENWESRFPKKTLEKVNSSFKKGIQIQNEGIDGAKHLAQMIEFTEKRKGIALRNEEYFNTMLHQFKDSSTVLVATLNHDLLLENLEKRKAEYMAQKAEFNVGAPKKLKQITKLLEDTEKEIEKVKEQKKEDGANVNISALLLVHDGNTCELLYSGLNEKYRRYLSAYSLRYKAIEWAATQGCKYFNFGGVEGSLDDGLFTFKSSFNPKINVYVGEFDLCCNRILYPILTKAIQVKKARQLKKRGNV